MQHAAVTGFGFVKVFEPLLNLAVLSDLQRRKMLQGGLGFGAERIVDAEGRRCLDAGAEQRVHEDAIAGGAHRFGTVLPSGSMNQISGETDGPVTSQSCWGCLTM